MDPANILPTRTRKSTIGQRRAVAPASNAELQKKQRKDRARERSRQNAARARELRRKNLLHESASFGRLRNPLNPAFHNRAALKTSNWELDQGPNKNAKPSGPKFTPLDRAWANAIKAAGRCPDIDVLDVCADRHAYMIRHGNDVQKAAAKRSLVSRLSVLGWAGPRELLGSRTNLIWMLDPTQRDSWLASSQSTKEFMVYMSRQMSLRKKRGKKRQRKELVAVQVSANMGPIDDHHNSIHYHQLAVMVRQQM